MDARGKVCPLPILELAKAMRSAAPGEVVLLLATDPAVEADLHAWCESTGATVEHFETGTGELKAWVRKGS